VLESARDTLAGASAFALYRAAALPPARCELRRWRQAAAKIPDPTLRRHAVAALGEKALNVEAIAVFGTLAPRRWRGEAVRAMATLQIAIDYLDSLGEHSGPDPLGDGLQLHAALGAAVSPGAGAADWYGLHPQDDDGGYLARLVGACQEFLRALPSLDPVLPVLQRAVARCGEGQSRTHAAALGQRGQLQEWARRLPAAAAYPWWETAAGASSSVAAHALIAAAADPGAGTAEAELIDAAYFPSIGALTVLLDDLVDREADAANGDHNYLDYCTSGAVTADRLSLLAARAAAAAADLPRPRRQRAIVSGIAAFYLAAEGFERPDQRPLGDCLAKAVGPPVALLRVVMRRRWRKRPGRAHRPSGP
jgi:tetraprenyl-beta-curcumene synthase